jgi:hypothetical protein
MALRKNAHALIIVPMRRDSMFLHVGHVVGGAPPAEAPGSVVTRVSIGFAETIILLAHAASRELAASYNAIT